MRLKVLRPWGMAAIYLMVHLGLGACASSQQEDSEEVEATEETSEEGNQQANGEEAAAPEGGGEAAATEGEAGAEAAPANAAATESTDTDLQNIMAEGSGDAAAANPAAAAPVDNATAAANPAAAGNPTAANVPANAPAAAPADAAAQATPGTPAGQGLPEMGSKMPYIVARGDTLGKIATKIYGDQSQWSKIQQLTGLSNPNRIYPGDVVYYQLTEQTVAFATSYEAAPRGEVQAAPGDTLKKIAAKVTGSSQNWRTVWRENGHVDDPNKVPAGSTVYYVNRDGAPSAQVEVKSLNVSDNNAVSDMIVDFVNVDAQQNDSNPTSSTGFVGLFSIFANVSPLG